MEHSSHDIPKRTNRSDSSCSHLSLLTRPPPLLHLFSCCSLSPFSFLSLLVPPPPLQFPLLLFFPPSDSDDDTSSAVPAATSPTLSWSPTFSALSSFTSSYLSSPSPPPSRVSHSSCITGPGWVSVTSCSSTSSLPFMFSSSILFPLPSPSLWVPPPRHVTTVKAGHTLVCQVPSHLTSVAPSNTENISELRTQTSTAWKSGIAATSPLCETMQTIKVPSWVTLYLRHPLLAHFDHMAIFVTKNGPPLQSWSRVAIPLLYGNLSFNKLPRQTPERNAPWVLISIESDKTTSIYNVSTRVLSKQ